MWTSRIPQIAQHDGSSLSFANFEFSLSVNTFFSYSSFLDFSYNILLTSISSASFVPSISQFFDFLPYRLLLFCACHFSATLTFISIFLQLSSVSVFSFPSRPPVFLTMTWHLFSQNYSTSSTVFLPFCSHNSQIYFSMLQHAVAHTCKI